METKTHYVVTGGAGFIGSRVIGALLQQPDVHITCIDNFDPFYRRQVKLLNIEGFDKTHHFFMRDIDLATVRNEELHQAIPQKVDAILHFAARAGVRPSMVEAVGYQQSNIVGTQKLLDFAAEKKVPKFIFASSSSVYGNNENMPWKEDAMAMPVSPYGMTKRSAELAGYVYQQTFGLQFLALRFFTVYGPGQRPDLAIHRFTKAILQGKPVTVFGDGTTSRDYTFIDDAVKAVLAALQYSATPYEVFNIGNNVPVALKELLEKLETLLGKKAEIIQQPEQQGDLKKTLADISKAQKLLQYQPATQVDEGLKKFMDWYKANEGILALD